MIKKVESGTKDFAKMMSEFKIPGFDAEVLLAAQRRNMEALAEANKAIAAGFEKLAQRQGEILQAAMGTFQGRAKVGGTPKEAADNRLDLASAAFGSALESMRAMAEVTNEANRNALDAIQRRFVESLDEFKHMIEKK